MGRTKAKKLRRNRSVVGKGGIISTVINKAIDLLPFEAHVPGGYEWCGPGTKVAKRLARGDKGINPLDAACKQHDIAYSKYSDSDRRREADKELAEQAWKRFKSPDSSVGEKAAALAVTAAMKAKAKFGGGKRKSKQTKRKTPKNSGKGLYLRPYPKQGGGQKKKRCMLKKKSRSR